VSIKDGATNIFVRHGNYSINSQGPNKVARKLKGISLEKGCTKSAENLGASPLKRDLLVDTTFSQTILLDSPFKDAVILSVTFVLEIKMHGYKHSPETHPSALFNMPVGGINLTVCT
jgi:hypothetical protein